MATYQQVPLAGDQDAQKVFRLTILNFDCSDAPRLTAWDTYACNTVAKESLAGTTESSDKSCIYGFDTTAALTGGTWIAGTDEESGGVYSQGARLLGSTSYIQLGNPALPPVQNDVRYFTLAFGVASDSGAGITGHDCVISLTLFYTGSAPTIQLDYNSALSETPTWVTLNMQNKGIAGAPAMPHTVFATGPDTTTSNLDPVTKPASGVKASEEYWAQTAA